MKTNKYEVEIASRWDADENSVTGGYWKAAVRRKGVCKQNGLGRKNAV